MRDLIERALSRRLDAKLVKELLQAHSEVKKHFYLGGLRLAEVEGGRFCEAAFRLLENIAWGAHTPLGTQIDSDKLLDRLRCLPSSTCSDSVRLHIPRSLRLVYDIRNKRDAAHLADGIDPNLQDAALVVSVTDWVLAEFIRMYDTNSPNEAFSMVERIVTKSAPVVQDFSGHLKVLAPKISASSFCLALLYHRGTDGCTFSELLTWVRPSMRANLKRTLVSLSDQQDLLHYKNARYFITRLGEIEVEKRKLFDP